MSPTAAIALASSILLLRAFLGRKAARRMPNMRKLVPLVMLSGVALAAAAIHAKKARPTEFQVCAQRAAGHFRRITR
jgi:hypothetical protein